MDTTITMTVQQILIWILIIAGIVAVIYLAALLSKLGKLMKPTKEAVEKLNLVLDDVKDITANVDESTIKAKKALNSASNSMMGVARIIDANKGPISALTSILGAGAGVASLMGLSKKATKAKIGKKAK
ncbi:MAG: hypothetical protein Q4E99_01365 [Bacillota bacterium]|nr:hypothetical protein [Bacillota bacterium]